MSGAGSANCIFCKIISGSIQSPRVAEDDDFICIRDIQPQAPQHFLVIPKEHIVDLVEAFPEAGESRAILIGKMFEFGAGVARKQGLVPAGFRSVINTGKQAGQTVFHVHLHLMGGAPLHDSFG